MPPSFGEVVERSLELLERRGRVSHTALRLEFDLDDRRLSALVDELVLVLEAATDDGSVLTSCARPALEAAEQHLAAPPTTGEADDAEVAPQAAEDPEDVGVGARTPDIEPADDTEDENAEAVRPADDTDDIDVIAHADDEDIEATQPADDTENHPDAIAHADDEDIEATQPTDAIAHADDDTQARPQTADGADDAEAVAQGTGDDDPSPYGAQPADEAGDDQAVAPTAAENAADIAEPAPPTDPPASPAPAPTAAAARETSEVAVLLCELVFTPPPEALEREAHRATTVRVHAICDEVARRFDAHAQPWVGDGVAIFFGHPRLHGDEPQRAVRCGWELVRAIDAARGVLEREHEVAVRARIAIATGAAGSGADDPFGSLPHVAAGVQATGDIGTVTVDATTFALIATPASFQPAGEHALAPGGDPVALHRLVAPLAVAGAQPAQTAAPFIGRSGERALLRALADRARAGTRSAVMLRGESGIGKTRAIEALREIAAGDLGMAVLACECSPYHRGSALGPVIQSLRRADPAGAAAATRRSDDASPGRARRELLAALASTIAEHARRRPLLLVVEDLQWADPSTLELLGMLIAGTPDLPLLLALTARQDVVPLPGAVLQVIDVPGLGDVELRRVVAAAAAGGALADDVVAELAERAGGSPLLAEELTRTMLTTQDSEDRELIPATLYGCLMARLNRDGAARAVAQLAATIGREFDLELLRAIGTLDRSELDWGLERLVADGVVRAGRDGTYAFRHALLQDVARSSLRRGALRANNLKIARTLLGAFPEIAALEPERVARHLEYAGELVESVGHWQRAAGDAQRRGAQREAAWHLERALMLTSRLPATPQRVAMELELRVLAARAHAATGGWEDPVAAAHRRRAELLGTVAEHTPQSLRATLGLTRQKLFEGRADDALALAKMQAETAKSAIEPELELEAACELGGALLLAGQPRPAIDQLDRALEIYEPGRDRDHAVRFGRDPAAIALTHRALALACRDDREGARAAAAAAAQILRARRHPFSEAWVHCGAATAALICGDRDVVGREAAIALQIAGREGFAGWHAHASVLQGWARVLDGEHEDGLAQLRGGVAAWDATGAGALRSWHACLQAGALLACEELDDGSETIEAGLVAIEAGLVAIEGGERWCEPELYRLRAELLRAAGLADRAAASAQLAIVCARKMYAPAWERRAAQTLAGLAGAPHAT